ncbi:phosphate ABC transporter substrate-binding protein PstS [Luteimonas sp. YGD11-2]|uniref:phosphate ABC transporter substrate-binding protein PstS n=1 Tax=Luteimonas sp. YGD11-2 TaxID=2508168 RepID=UPI000C243854|nr:phosphate ABC transporter substrate-binding protein PstS [Luteimonas sp. YGD11-2]PJJ99405.1 phosphate ABC transporter substrate-binding protein PstS [Xanthomonadaceae bacterium NML91-0213]
MNLSRAGLATLALSITIGLAACQPSDNAGNATGAPSADGTATRGSGNRVVAEISGAGASFIFPLVSKWSADYNAATGHRVNYQSIGSGGGIAQIKAGTVDFGSSDRPLDSNELSQAGLGQFPSAIGGVVPVVNIEGLAPGQLRLDGPTLARIFLGEITTWNDPAIVALNGGTSLPSGKISIVHRSDGSGTTFNFTNYLSKVSPEWKSRVGEGTTVQWSTGVGGKGNEGVASYVQQIRGSIGYVELAYALQNSMPYASLRNAAGNWVEPSEASFAAAAETADWANAQDFNLVITDAPGAEAWPITATNFMLMHKQPRDAERARATLEFFQWAFANGKTQAAELHYVPLPEPLVQQVQAYWQSEFGFQPQQ